MDDYPSFSLPDIVHPTGRTGHVLVVDLKTGQWHHTNRLIEELIPGSDLPPTALVHAVGDAAALSPQAAARRSGDY